MKIRIRRALTSNLGLKVLALFFAIVLWLVVVNVENPTRTKTFTAKVQVLKRKDMYYMLTIYVSNVA